MYTLSSQDMPKPALSEGWTGIYGRLPSHRFLPGGPLFLLSEHMPQRRLLTLDRLANSLLIPSMITNRIRQVNYEPPLVWLVFLRDYTKVAAMNPQLSCSGHVPTETTVIFFPSSK